MDESILSKSESLMPRLLPFSLKWWASSEPLGNDSASVVSNPREASNPATPRSKTTTNVAVASSRSVCLVHEFKMCPAASDASNNPKWGARDLT